MMKKFFKRAVLLTLLIAGLCPTLMAQKTHEFTIKQAVEYAMQNNVTVKNALLDVRIQQQANNEIVAVALPQINSSAQFTDYLKLPTSLIPAEFFGGQPGTYMPVQFGTKYNSSGSIDVRQILFDGQVFVGLQARDATLKLAGLQAELTKEQIKVNVEKIYYQLVVGKQQITSIDANIFTTQKLLDNTREIFNNGFAERLDVDKVTVLLNNMVTEKEKAQWQLNAGNTALKFLLNIPQKDSLRLADTLTEDMLKENLLDSAYDYNNRKELQALNVSKELNQFNIRRYRLSYIPTLSAFASYQKNAQRSKFDFFSDKKWFTTSMVGLNISFTIFDGFAKRSKINQAKFALEKTNNSIEQLKASIDNDVEQARLKIKSALITMDVQKQNKLLAEKVYNSTKLKFEQGLGSQQEIYNAQAELKVAQNNYYSAIYDAIIARIDYLKAIGKL